MKLGFCLDAGDKAAVRREATGVTPLETQAAVDSHIKNISSTHLVINFCPPTEINLSRTKPGLDGTDRRIVGASATSFAA